MLRPTVHAAALALGAALVMTSACTDERECPDGHYKDGKWCRKIDAGQDAAADADDEPSTEANEAAVSAGDGSLPTQPSDASPSTLPDASVTIDAAADAAADSAAPIQVEDSGTDASNDAAPPPECDATRMCAPGLVCANAKCVNACTQTQCDPNATCSLVANAPTCSCNRGYTAVSGSGTNVTCMRNLACDQLGCDAKATCEGTQEAGFMCRCISGYMGNGKSCTPVTCDAPPTVPNFSWPSASVTFGGTTTGACNAGYEPAGGNLTLLCSADKTWVGAVPSCKARDCGQPALPKLPDGTVSGTFQLTGGTTYGARANYSCNLPFALSSNTERVCQANGTWGGNVPKCVGCGDQEVTGNERCDIATASHWTCDPTSCQLNTEKVYRPCSDASMCDSGQLCVSGTCTVLCSGGAACPSAPPGSNSSAMCLADNGVCVAKCSSTADCAPGLACNSLGRCTACSASNPCPGGKTCLMYGTGTIGRCL